MNTWEAIGNMIKAQGVDFVFGVGDTDLQLFLNKVAGLKLINVRYEGSAPFMAMAYSRLSGKPGICSASCGPGVANLVPGMLEAYYACSPILAICPVTSQRNEGMADIQECDQIGMMKSITKWSARIPYKERTPWYLHRAFSLAMNGQPGPVYLELPYDVGGTFIHHEQIEMGKMEYTPAKKIRIAGQPELIDEAVQVLIKEKRVVVIAGSGVILSNAYEEFKEFIELLGIPFLTTPGGRGIVSESHPLALGTCGIYRTKVGKQYQSEASLLITIGTRNESLQTHEWADFPKGAKYIQIDISPFEIGRNWLPDIGIVGDAKLVLRQLIDEIKRKAGDDKSYKDIPRVKEIAKAKQEFATEVDTECRQDEIPIPAKSIVHELSAVFGKDTILVNENGSQDTWSYCFPYYSVQDGSACIPVAEQTCMGMGVVGAIAAKLTMPEKKVVCVSGDGAFQMYMKELPTAAQYKVGCTWVVLNNSALGWVKALQQETAGWDTCSFNVQPDFTKLAEACKCFGKRVEKPSEVRPALQQALEMNEKGIPAVLDFVTGLDLSHFERS